MSCLGSKIKADKVGWALISLAMGSLADTAIIPLQDILGLGKEARMNFPGTLENNWKWRFLPDALSQSIQKRLLQMTQESQRI